MKPCTAILFGLLAAGTAAADWEATGVDDNGWFEYRVTEREGYVSDHATMEFYHYGTGERRTIYLKRDRGDDDYFERDGRKMMKRRCCE